MASYGMVIDLKRCYGCYACSMACKVKNHTPPGVFWARVLKGEEGSFPNTIRQALPVLCHHSSSLSGWRKRINNMLGIARTGGRIPNIG